jgi:hypothetical protein
MRHFNSLWWVKLSPSTTKSGESGSVYVTELPYYRTKLKQLQYDEDSIYDFNETAAILIFGLTTNISATE